MRGRGLTPARATGFVPTEEEGTRPTAACEAELKKTFRPEFSGRIDEYERLSPSREPDGGNRPAVVAALDGRLQERVVFAEVTEEALALLGEQAKATPAEREAGGDHPLTCGGRARAGSSGGAVRQAAWSTSTSGRSNHRDKKNKPDQTIQACPFFIMQCVPG